MTQKVPVKLGYIERLIKRQKEKQSWGDKADHLREAASDVERREESEIEKATKRKKNTIRTKGTSISSSLVPILTKR